MVLHHRSHLNASAVIKSLPEAGVTFVVLNKADPTEDLGSKPVSQFPGGLEENPIDRYTRYRGLRQVSAFYYLLLVDFLLSSSLKALRDLHCGCVIQVIWTRSQCCPLVSATGFWSP